MKMKNPFSFFSASKRAAGLPDAYPYPDRGQDEPVISPARNTPEREAAVPDDGFHKWLRTATRGGIEPGGRNDIYETYSVYGADAEGRIIHRCYHRYPEHERAFDLSCSRVLTFDELNRHLLEELDKGGVTLDDYHACIAEAERLAPQPSSDAIAETEFSEDEYAVLRDFCESLDTLKDKECHAGRGSFRCSGVSVVGDEELWLNCRKPLTHDALYGESLGISRTEIGGYDIENLWILSVYNRLRERCDSCRVILLKSEWNLSQKPVTLLVAEGVQGISGALLVTVADIETLSRFGAYSLTFLRR